MFHRWLTAARARRHKRIILREKELELDRASVRVAWDRWRERYMDEKLRPLVSFAISLTMRTCLTLKFQLFQIAIQNQKNCLFRAFGVWHSKTRVCVTIPISGNVSRQPFLVTPSDPLPGLTNKDEILEYLESCNASGASS